VAAFWRYFVYSVFIARYSRSLNSQGLYTPCYVPYGMGGFQPQSMESIWTVFWLATQPFFHSIPTTEFPMNLNCKSMYYFIRIPWNSPYGISWESTIKCIVKNSVYIKNQTLDCVKCHVGKRENDLTAVLCNH